MDRLMQTLPVLAAIAFGGAAGALARFGISQAVIAVNPRMVFPLGTFIANIVGCLAIGFCFYWFAERGEAMTPLRSGLQVGLIGALTTFSTFSIESLDLLMNRQYGHAAANIVLSVVLGLAAAYVGIVLARAVIG